MITTVFTPAKFEPQRLEAGEVHLWRVELGGATPGDEVLEPPELERIGRLVDPETRSWRLNCRRILRRLLGAYLNRPPAELRLLTGPHGRPHLDPQVHRTDLNFNLSHAGSLAAIALARTPRLGVDIEPVRPLRRRQAVLERCFSAAERRRLHAHPPTEREALFFRAWTAKEAVLKAEGTGVFHDPAAVEVGWTPALEPARGIANAAQVSGWKLWEFAPGADIHGTLALPPGDWSVRCLTEDRVESAPIRNEVSTRWPT